MLKSSEPLHQLRRHRRLDVTVQGAVAPAALLQGRLGRALHHTTVAAVGVVVLPYGHFSHPLDPLLNECLRLALDPKHPRGFASRD